MFPTLVLLILKRAFEFHGDVVNIQVLIFWSGLEHELQRFRQAPGDAGNVGPGT